MALPAAKFQLLAELLLAAQAPNRAVLQGCSWEALAARLPQMRPIIL